MGKVEATILLTRPERASRRLAEKLGDCGARVVISPIMQIEPVAGRARPPDDAVLVVTSRNGVDMAGKPMLAGRSGYVVGAATAAAARRAGLTVLGTAEDAAGLARLLIAEHPASPLWHLRGEFSTAALPEALAAAGMNLRPIVLYRQVAMPLSAEARDALSAPGAVILPVFSPRSAALLAEAVAAGRPGAELHLVSISQAVDRAWTGIRPSTRRIASGPVASAMIEEIRKALGQVG